MDFHLVLQSLQFDEHLAWNSEPSEGFPLLRKDKLDCLNLSCFCLNCFKLPDSIHNHAFPAPSVVVQEYVVLLPMNAPLRGLQESREHRSQDDHSHNHSQNIGWEQHARQRLVLIIEMSYTFAHKRSCTTQ
jgi:hypothetical protein